MLTMLALMDPRATGPIAAAVRMVEGTWAFGGGRIGREGGMASSIVNSTGCHPAVAEVEAGPHPAVE